MKFSFIFCDAFTSFPPAARASPPPAQTRRIGRLARPLTDTPIVNAARYRARSLPIAGMLLKEEDRGEEQISLL